MSNQRAMIWFRNDLRLHDHEALSLLASSMDVLVPVYCLDPQQFEIQPLGFPRLGPLRARFLIECLEDLRIGLEMRGSGLYVELGEPEKVIPRLAQALGVQVVFTEREILGEGARAERRLAAALESLGIPLRRYWVNTLVHSSDLPFPVANLPEQFSQFREAVMADREPRVPLPPLQMLPAYPAELTTPTLAALVQTVELSTALEAGQDSGFKGGATVALAKLQEFVQGRRVSLDTLRGGAREADAARVDQFAPWLARGAISPRRIYQYIEYSGLAAWAGKLATGTIDELLKRDFCRFLALKGGERAEQFDRAATRNDEGARERFERWRRGETGESFVDAHLRELAHTGHLTSFGRRLVASYLYHDLRLDWRWGAAWFASRLLDDDPSVNLADWMAVTGFWRLDQQARLDPAEQAARRDPDGSYTHRWLKSAPAPVRRVGQAGA